MKGKRTPGKWMDCGHVTLLHPVTQTAVTTCVVEAKGFGRIGEWHDYSNEPEGNFQAILNAVNSHDDLLAACKRFIDLGKAGGDTSWHSEEAQPVFYAMMVAIGKAEGTL